MDRRAAVYPGGRAGLIHGLTDSRSSEFSSLEEVSGQEIEAILGFIRIATSPKIPHNPLDICMASARGWDPGSRGPGWS